VSQERNVRASARQTIPSAPSWRRADYPSVRSGALTPTRAA
jgi:hypothetical protein